MSEESDGTQKLYRLAGLVMHILEMGFLLVIDELDASLHPLMSRAIVQLFNSSKTNPNNAQLIFTTHDTNLLDIQLFRRDQIWFTEKNRYGSTDLYSLYDSARSRVSRRSLMKLVVIDYSINWKFIDRSQLDF
jgi:uncharacterized protein